MKLPQQLRLAAVTVGAVLAFAGTALAQPPDFISKGQVQSTLGFSDANVAFSYSETLTQVTPCAISTPGGVFTDNFQRTVVLSGPAIYEPRVNPAGVVTGYNF